MSICILDAKKRTTTKSTTVAVTAVKTTSRWSEEPRKKQDSVWSKGLPRALTDFMTTRLSALEDSRRLPQRPDLRTMPPIIGTSVGSLSRTSLLQEEGATIDPTPDRTILEPPGRTPSGRLTRRMRRLFFIGGTRIKHVASAARRSVPHPKGSKSPYAFVIEDLTEDALKPDINTAKSWVAWLTSKKLSRGYVIIMDSLTSTTWKDYGFLEQEQELDEPHALKPSPVSFHHNNELLTAIEAVEYLLKSITAPVITYVLGPCPRYLHGPCCGEQGHMEWNTDLPLELMAKLNVVDMEVRPIINRRINATYITARKLAEAAMNSQFVNLRTSNSELPTDSTPLSIWKVLTTPSNLYMTAQSAKLIWAEAINHCSEERFVRAIELVREKAGTHGGLGTSKLQAYQEALQRMALGEDELQTWRSSVAQAPQGAARSSTTNVDNTAEEDIEVVTLE